MDPQGRLTELLREHSFDLVRQRKHKVYRNPDGLTFVVASTPSDRNASHNALATLKRILRRVPTVECTPSSEPAAVDALAAELIPEIESVPKAEPSVIMPEEPMTEQEWEAWKRQYWHDEKLLAKNEKFLSAVGRYIERVSELMHTRKDVAPGPAADAIKGLLRSLHYKSKVVIYNCKLFHQGVIVHEAVDQPIVWATNGHIGISAFVFLNAYIQHGPSRPIELRFLHEGIPLLFEMPEKGRRRVIHHVEDRVILADLGHRKEKPRR